MRTIRITGKVVEKVHPDVTVLRITLQSTKKKYSEAVKSAADATNSLKELLLPLGFNKNDIKTLSFNVNPEHERYEEKKTYKYRLVGYSYNHELKVEFDSDNRRLGKILGVLTRSALKPEFEISYTVKDPEAVKRQLIVGAVRDAQEKAVSIAEAAGVHLKDIQSIDYSWGTINLEMRKMFSSADDSDYEEVEMSEEYIPDIEPNDIKVDDSVTVTWEIE